MQSPSSGERGSARRLVVALVIATAAAAVTAGMALNERHPASERQLAGANADAIGEGVAGPRADPSLPRAAEVLKDAPGVVGEQAPTF